MSALEGRLLRLPAPRLIRLHLDRGDGIWADAHRNTGSGLVAKGALDAWADPHFAGPSAL